MGRPITWTPDHPKIEEMLVRLAKGESLKKITDEPNMPSWTSVHELLDRDEGFRTRYARTRIAS